jgi:hypothetical protein
LKDGLLATVYQPLTPDEVKNSAITPASNGIKMDINNFIL